MSALADDQKAIEEILEGERIRMAESFRSAAAARKARDEKHAEEDAIEDKCVRTIRRSRAFCTIETVWWCFVTCNEQDCRKAQKKIISGSTGIEHTRQPSSHNSAP